MLSKDESKLAVNFAPWTHEETSIPSGKRTKLDTLQRHCTENSKQIFPEMKLVPNSYICERFTVYIPTIGQPILLQRERGRTVSFLGIHKSDLRLQCRH
jgi:hypothetical protein